MELPQAVKLSIANLISDGFDDVLPLPMEVELLRKTPKIVENLEIISRNKLNSYLNSSQSDKPSLEAFKKLSLFPLSYVLVPKKEAFDFRKIAIIRPEDLAVYQAIAIMIAEPFEKTRSDIARGRIFSYRFKPNLNGVNYSAQHITFDLSNLPPLVYLSKNQFNIS